MRILLLGANGQVGHELMRCLAPLGELIATTRSGTCAEGLECETLDLSQLNAIGPFVDRIGPDVVVNATAHTAVDRAESEPDAAYAANAHAPGRLADACARRGATLVHFSTDYVFDGTGTRPYRPEDATAPLGVYGGSKRAGEVAIVESGAGHLILRTAWVYGLRGSNFLRTMLRVGRERDELRVVADQIGTPTPAWLIGEATAEILRQGVRGSAIRHLVAGGQTSWHGFAEAIFDEACALGWMERAPRVIPIGTHEYPTPARRPAYSVLDTSALQAEYDLVLPDWKDALHRTLASGTPG